MDESNMLVRALLHGISLPTPPGANRFKRSGAIGNLERLVIYVFVVTGAPTAVGFVLTAKGLVRFHELSDANAAEYVLVGTLASSIIAIAIALLVLHMPGVSP